MGEVEPTNTEQLWGQVTHLRSQLFNMENQIKNIIFDLGGVIYDIRYQNIPEAFAQFGFFNFEEHYTQNQQTGPIDLFEEGNISVPEFRNYIRSLSPVPLTDEQIDEAWNAIIIDVPEKRVEMLESLKPKYNLYLFSNTNELNYNKFCSLLQQKFGFNIFERCFIKAYFSHLEHIRKPLVSAFQYVLEDAKLKPDETLFIDDTERHIEGAKKVGLHTYLLPKGEDVVEMKWLHS